MKQFCDLCSLKDVSWAQNILATFETVSRFLFNSRSFGNSFETVLKQFPDFAQFLLIWKQFWNCCFDFHRGKLPAVVARVERRWSVRDIHPSYIDLVIIWDLRWSEVNQEVSILGKNSARMIDYQHSPSLIVYPELAQLSERSAPIYPQFASDKQ